MLATTWFRQASVILTPTQLNRIGFRLLKMQNRERFKRTLLAKWTLRYLAG